MSVKQKSNFLARQELLVVLSYLLYECDEKHPAKQSDIIQYAKEKFHININKRQRIAEALFDLKCLSDEFKGILPFEVKEVCTGKKYKYYASITSFDDTQIETILRAIKKERHTSFVESKEIINTFLSLIANKFSAEKFQYDLKKYYPISLIDSLDCCMDKNKLNTIKKAIKNKLFVKMRIYDLSAVKGEKKSELKKEVTCYIYKQLIFHDLDYIIYVDVQDGLWRSVPVNNIKILSTTSFIEDVENHDYNKLFMAPAGYKSIEDYLKIHIIPYDNKIIKVRFKYHESYEKKIKTSFKKQFQRFMKWNRSDSSYHEVEFEVQEKLFTSWVLNNDYVLHHIQILYPISLIENITLQLQKELRWLSTNKAIAEQEHCFKINLFKDERSYYLSHDTSCSYSEIYHGTSEMAHARADELMKEYDSNYKEVVACLDL